MGSGRSRAEYRSLGVPRFRIRRLRHPFPRPWCVYDYVTGEEYLVSTWRRALELAEAVAK